MLENIGRHLLAEAKAEGNMVPVVVRYAESFDAMSFYFRQSTGLPLHLKHEHEMHEEITHVPGTEKALWRCDGCEKHGNTLLHRYSCQACQVDYCDGCYLMSLRKDDGASLPAALVIVQKVGWETFSHIFSWEHFDEQKILEFLAELKCHESPQSISHARPVLKFYS